MGWKGTVRSINAAAKAANREAERCHKATMKQQQIDDAAQAVEEWEGYIANLISVHVDLADSIDWEQMASKKKPSTPRLQDTHAKNVQLALEKFKPGFFDFLSGGSDKKKQSLIVKAEEATKKDKSEFDVAKNQHTADVIEWEQDTQLAKRLIAGDIAAVKEVIEEIQTLSKQDLIGAAISFRITEDFIHAMPEVHGDDIVPNFRRKQLASGNLSQTKMPIGDFNELYQDYVASVALKVAGDLFHILPMTEVYVTCVTSMLNTKTGHQELTPILSVHAVKETFKRLNLENIDPSDSLANFNYVMHFKRTKGFQPVQPLKPMQ